MKLKQKTQLDIDIENIEQYADTFLRSVASAIFSLNEAYTQVWNLPLERLQQVLQYLYDNNKLEPLLQNHNFAANSLNEILIRGEKVGATAFNTIGRDFTISESGEISLVVQEQVVTEEIIEE